MISELLNSSLRFLGYRDGSSKRQKFEKFDYSNFLCINGRKFEWTQVRIYTKTHIIIYSNIKIDLFDNKN